jgi:hypothetical protein
MTVEKGGLRLVVVPKGTYPEVVKADWVAATLRFDVAKKVSPGLTHGAHAATVPLSMHTYVFCWLAGRDSCRRVSGCTNWHEKWS